MTLPKLNITPAQDGYSAQDGDSVRRAKVSAGPMRIRLDMLGAPFTVNVTLLLDVNEYTYWRAFYRSVIAEGSLPFIMDLLLDSSDLVEYEVRMTGPPQLGSVRGLLQVVSFQVEAKVNVTDTSYDLAVVMLQNLYGSGGAMILSSLAELVNVDLPRSSP